MRVEIRPERRGERRAVHRLTREAFAGAEHSDGTEHVVVDALRRAGALSVSLVAAVEGEVVGHVAISPVTITLAASADTSTSGDSGPTGWFGLGPVSVRPELQGRGIGSALVRAALAIVEDDGASGCVVLGDPGYYGRFGFATDPRLTLPGVPAAYFQVLVFGADDVPHGTVAYHPAFEATG